MKDFATLLQGLAALLWPIFAFTVLFTFRPQLAGLLVRLKKGKLLGQEIELNESLEKLQQAAQDVEAEVATSPQQSSSSKTEAEFIQDQSIAQRIVSEATSSPKAALISLSAELERLAQEVLATTGHLGSRRFVPLQRAIDEIHQTYGLAAHVQSSLHHFWEVRTRIIHKGEGTDEDILRAIDSGLAILRALQAIPREINIVYEPNVPVFNDSGLTTLLTEVHGVLLESHSPSGVSKTYRIFPSSKNNFSKGKQVSWEWNMSLIVGPAWYRDVSTGESKEAWSSSAEFIGRHLDEL